MASGSAAYAAKKGVGMLFNATKTGFAALSQGIHMVRKGYADKHETGVLEDLRKTGKSPVEHLFDALRRVYYLYLAGYKNELAAAGRYTGKRMIDIERSSIPLDAVLVMSQSVCSEALKFGDFEKGIFTRSIQDYRNKSRMGKDHYDRDTLIHDVYYSLLLASEACGSDWSELEQMYREAVTRVVDHAERTTDPALADVVETRRATSILFQGGSGILKPRFHEREGLRGVTVGDRSSNAGVIHHHEFGVVIGGAGLVAAPDLSVILVVNHEDFEARHFGIEALKPMLGIKGRVAIEFYKEVKSLFLVRHK
ncbi:hypothetical protein SELMODRAFT_424266 [Selaginella moellendorffii]|uniref:Uncharacterized protein n=1 Tax=Selaginella moellendorffii TaxID=88036 RepID=D8SPC0_SELML|nr:hypothetical protein SELMODRAFT_424266 [Selaginella moellendorffii]